MIDLRGIEYFLFAGLGAMVGLLFGLPIIAFLALFYPALWAWVFAPAGVGAIIGLLVAVFAK